MSDEEKDFPWLAFLEPSPDKAGLVGQRVPENAVMMIHESHAKETAPMAIVKISMKAIDLVCLCRRSGCNLRLRLRVEKSGNHPTLEKPG